MSWSRVWRNGLVCDRVCIFQPSFNMLTNTTGVDLNISFEIVWTSKKLSRVKPSDTNVPHLFVNKYFWVNFVQKLELVLHFLFFRFFANKTLNFHPIVINLGFPRAELSGLNNHRSKFSVSPIWVAQCYFKVEGPRIIFLVNFTYSCFFSFSLIKRSIFIWL